MGTRSDVKGCAVRSQSVRQIIALWSATHTIAGDATQKSGGCPSSLLTEVKALGFLWLGLCNALCGRPLWAVWEGGRERGERGKVRLQRLLCQSTACCTDESTLVSKARGPEDATQKSGGVPSSLLTKVKASGLLWLGRCNALCARPLWVVWGRGKGEGERGAR